MEIMQSSKHIHLIGVCGTAMASLAGMLQARGHRITGSDAAAYKILDSEKSTRRLVHHIYDTTIIEDINFAVTGTPDPPIQPGGSGSKPK